MGSDSQQAIFSTSYKSRWSQKYLPTSPTQDRIMPAGYIRLTKYHTYHFSGPPKRSPMMMMMMMRQLFRVSWMQELTVPSASFLPRPLFVRLSTCQASAPAKMVIMLLIISSISLSLSNIHFSSFSSSKLHHFHLVSNQCYRIESENKFIASSICDSPD